MDMVKFAERVCGMAVQGRDYQIMPVRKLAITAKDTKGMYQYSYTGREGLELDCYLEYEAAHDGGTGPHSEEGWPESISLVYALHKGEDISEVLADDVVARIEEAALHKMCSDGWQDALDNAYMRKAA